MKKTAIGVMLAWLLLWPALAQSQGGSLQAKPSIYAVNSASLAAAMTYCIAKYGGMTQGSAGAACYTRARGLLVDMKLREWADGIDRKCAEPNTYSRCMTPEIGRLVYALNDTFARNRL